MNSLMKHRQSTFDFYDTVDVEDECKRLQAKCEQLQDRLDAADELLLRNAKIIDGLIERVKKCES